MTYSLKNMFVYSAIAYLTTFILTQWVYISQFMVPTCTDIICKQQPTKLLQKYLCIWQIVSLGLLYSCFVIHTSLIMFYNSLTGLFTAFKCLTSTLFCRLSCLLFNLFSCGCLIRSDRHDILEMRGMWDYLRCKNTSPVTIQTFCF